MLRYYKQTVFFKDCILKSSTHFNIWSLTQSRNLKKSRKTVIITYFEYFSYFFIPYQSIKYWVLTFVSYVNVIKAKDNNGIWKGLLRCSRDSLKLEFWEPSLTVILKGQNSLEKSVVWSRTDSIAAELRDLDWAVRSVIKHFICHPHLKWGDITSATSTKMSVFRDS